LAVHGGAGEVRRRGLTARGEQAICAALTSALEAGARILDNGGTSLDAVEDAVRRLEDSPLFNAGKGAVFNARGEHELEASIMDGRTLEAGAVAAVRGIKNPVTLARWVMERSPHVFLQGQGAVAFATSHGMELVDPEYFWTQARWTALLEARSRAASDSSASPERSTVGAVAYDRQRNLAAATSTGGMTNKLEGRVGDSSIIGAGTYASNSSSAVSCTGHGEYFIRATAARDVCAIMEYAGRDVRTAVETVIRLRVAELGGDGGIMAVDNAGTVVFVFNTEAMFRGCVTQATSPRVAIYREPELL
jgi:beta-aspartyl-peptidase (threonine type)